MTITATVESSSSPRQARGKPVPLGRLLVGLAVVLALVLAMLTAGARPASALTGDIRMHDPSVLKVGDCFYGASTGFEGGPGGGSVTIRKTCDPTLHGGWTFVGTVWDSVPAWITERLGKTPPNIWAPDLNHVNGEYRLYYGASLWGQGYKAVMGLVTAPSPEGPWTDRGPVTDVNYPIDPDIAYSGSTPYVHWGSWNGVYLHVLDEATGKLSTTDHNLWKLATGIEGASIAFHDGWFYLYGSRGSCCSGVKSTYYTVVGRSKSISGPYLDKSGRRMADGGGTTVLTGAPPKVAAGGGDVFVDGPLQRFAYHYYDANAAGRETLDIRTIRYVDGWPTMSAPVGPLPPLEIDCATVDYTGVAPDAAQRAQQEIDRHNTELDARLDAEFPRYLERATRENNPAARTEFTKLAEDLAQTLEERRVAILDRISPALAQTSARTCEVVESA